MIEFITNVPGLGPVDVADFRRIQNTPKWTLSGTLDLHDPGRRRRDFGDHHLVLPQQDLPVRDAEPLSRPAGLCPVGRASGLDEPEQPLHDRAPRQEHPRRAIYHVGLPVPGHQSGDRRPDAGGERQSHPEPRPGRHRHRLLRQSAPGLPAASGSTSADAAAGSRSEGTGPGGRVLLILLLAYIFNFIDRQIIGILAVPIKAEFGLSDTALSAARRRLRHLLRDHRHPDRLARRPQEPRHHHRRLDRPVEPVHRGLRAGAEFRAAGAGADGRRVRRGGRDRALLFADRRFLPEVAAGAGAGLLLAGHPDRLGARHLLRRLARPPI